MNSQIQKAAEIITKGGIVSVPTETVYGLAANALDENAVRKIFSAKGRPFIDPLIVHVSGYDMLGEIAELGSVSKKIADAFWPGALTLILKKNACVPGIVTAGFDTVAVRMPAHPMMRELINACALPLAAPSANPFGYISPTRAQHVRDQLGDKVDMILDGGECACGIESTIVMTPDVSPDGRLLILRQGPVSAEDIEKAAEMKASVPENNPAHPVAPGMLKNHYSPHSKLTLFNNESEIPEAFAGRVVFFKRPENPKSSHYWLSEDGNAEEAARNLFALLRTLDKDSSSEIFCQKAPESGIGAAINDRLSRAQHKL